LINSPTKRDHEKALLEGKRILEDKKLIKFAREESSEPIVKNPVMNKVIRNKREEFKAKAEDNKVWSEANKPNADTSKGGYVPWYQRMADEAKEKEEEDPRTEGRMEELQKIEDKGKSWFVKHLKKSQ